jgi:hypothetical protein
MLLLDGAAASEIATITVLPLRITGGSIWHTKTQTECDSRHANLSLNVTPVTQHSFLRHEDHFSCSRKRERQPSARAKALVCERLKHGPRPEASAMAAASCAEISERALIAAADALGVRTQRGQWWLPVRFAPG